ncbi:MFS transporter [Actinoplanes oblitus]|uniref:MFS transporter n=1 Tax=Actinoplanes oblitus TaxID=3040509 RepID=A0ABY8WGS2_9ACTN|nr:MFS transporter [Actinoplanes oblitus]WIM96243.1 MFS transporter [Actinoplanes oblitus]
MVRRGLALFSTLVMMVVASVAWAVAAPSNAYAVPNKPPKPTEACTLNEWKNNTQQCVDRLVDAVGNKTTCDNAPTPSTPDSGLAGWFTEMPEASTEPGPKGMYTLYGYSGYNFPNYDPNSGCIASITEADSHVESTIANGEFMLATAIIGASNALRERAWDPQSLWGWADTLVQQATTAVYQKVFTVFGVITLAIVGLYLIWRSRQADMGAATTTAGWAILVMVGVTAIAAWPVKSANLADQTLVTSLNVIHGAIGPQPKTAQNGADCILGKADACTDKRPPAVRASDTATETVLYRNWLRGVLGSADSETAQKYGMALYSAHSLRWDEAETIRKQPALRDGILSRKNAQWTAVAEQIKTEDPEAYEYLQGAKGMERIGSGFVAVLAAAMFAMFDLTASILVLLGFLIFRWAVIAAPILGTVGLLRPASAGIRRLGNAVVAAIFNIAIFGTGAAIYLFAVDLIMNTATLPGWLQVVLVWLCGVVGWLLLRPYRRITQLGGKDSAAAIASAGSWHRRFFRDMREAAKLEVAEGGGTREPIIGKDGRVVFVEQRNLRPEARLEDPAHAAATRGETVGATPDESRPALPTRPDGTETVRTDKPVVETTSRPVPTRTRRNAEWTEPDVAERPASYAIYRPETGATTEEPATPRVRSEAR